MASIRKNQPAAAPVLRRVVSRENPSHIGLSGPWGMVYAAPPNNRYVVATFDLEALSNDRNGNLLGTPPPVLNPAGGQPFSPFGLLLDCYAYSYDWGATLVIFGAVYNSLYAGVAADWRELYRVSLPPLEPQVITGYPCAFSFLKVELWDENPSASPTLNVDCGAWVRAL